MDLLLWRRDDYQRLYNCSVYKVDHIPIEERRSVMLGSLMLLLFLISFFLYVPCMVVLWRKQLSQCCYKIMFSIGVTDILALWFNLFQAGLFSLMGVVYCSYPDWMFFSGMVVGVCWSFESTAAVLLAANRCITFVWPKVGNFLFRGWRTWLWVYSVVIYSVWYLFFTNPPLFTSISFVFNPHKGYIEGVDELYLNHVDLYAVISTSAAITLFYAIFLIDFSIKSSTTAATFNNQERSFRVFLQTFLISAVNAFTCFIYISTLFLPSFEALNYFCMFLWAFCHVIPPYIYIGINPTLRKEILKTISAACTFKANTMPISTLNNINNRRIIPINVVPTQPRINNQ